MRLGGCEWFGNDTGQPCRAVKFGPLGKNGSIDMTEKAFPCLMLRLRGSQRRPAGRQAGRLAGRFVQHWGLERSFKFGSVLRWLALSFCSQLLSLLGFFFLKFSPKIQKNNDHWTGFKLFRSSVAAILLPFFQKVFNSLHPRWVLQVEGRGFSSYFFQLLVNPTTFPDQTK